MYSVIKLALKNNMANQLKFVNDQGLINTSVLYLGDSGAPDTSTTLLYCKLEFPLHGSVTEDVMLLGIFPCTDPGLKQKSYTASSV